MQLFLFGLSENCFPINLDQALCTFEDKASSHFDRQSFCFPLTRLPSLSGFYVLFTKLDLAQISAQSQAPSPAR
jgi:hypothetical protein